MKHRLPIERGTAWTLKVALKPGTDVTGYTGQVAVTDGLDNIWSGSVSILSATEVQATLPASVTTQIPDGITVEGDVVITPPLGDPIPSIARFVCPVSTPVSLQ